MKKIRTIKDIRKTVVIGMKMLGYSDEMTIRLVDEYEDVYQNGIECNYKGIVIAEDLREAHLQGRKLY